MRSYKIQKLCQVVFTVRTTKSMFLYWKVSLGRDIRESAEVFQLIG